MTKPTFGKIATHGLDTPNGCDICGKSRAHGNHDKCSKIRQAHYREKANG